MSEKINTQSLSDSEIETLVKEQVAKIFGRQKEKGVSPKWGVAEHCGLIKNVMVELGMPEDDITSILKALQFKGLGGNAAQFRQWDVVKSQLPASAKDIVNAMDY